MNSWAAVVLAAGKGSRMKSKRPKVLHEICGRPVVSYVLDTLSKAGFSSPVIVVGEGASEVRATLGTGFSYAEQREQLGTGHALAQAKAILPNAQSNMIVINGDVPFLTVKTLQSMIRAHEAAGAALTLLSADVPNPSGLGRIVRDSEGYISSVIEESDATKDELLITEVNVGAYCLQMDWVWRSVQRLAPHNSGELYLTDLVVLAIEDGLGLETVRIADPAEAIGVDNRLKLAEAEGIERKRVCDRWMLEGVTIIDPTTTFIDSTVSIGQDSIIHPYTTLSGKTTVGDDCTLGPGSILIDSTIGHECKVTMSVLEDAVLEPGVHIGPYSHIRPGGYVESGTHIGNFVEIKKSHLGEGVSIGHFSYIGDATIGRNVNIGAGTITCNYDGIEKLPTVIEDEVFVGCDTMLVAPVTMKTRSRSGAGAVVNRDVPANTTVAGVPARRLSKRPAANARSATRGAKPPSTAAQHRKE